MALANTLLSVFMTSTSLKPFRCHMGRPGSPLSITLVLYVCRRMAARTSIQTHPLKDLE
jgi:hypothetical protein